MERWRWVLITVPHATCHTTIRSQLEAEQTQDLWDLKGQMSHGCDYAAYTIARRLTERLNLGTKVKKVIGWINRSVCDLNRGSCPESALLGQFWERIEGERQNNIDQPIMLDIHSFPPWEMEGLEVAILDPFLGGVIKSPYGQGPAPYAKNLVTFLHSRGVRAGIIPGNSQNEIVNRTSSEKNGPISMLIEFNEELLNLATERDQDGYLTYDLTSRGEEIVDLIVEWMLSWYDASG